MDELAEVLEHMQITGQEVWLDCLLLALEEEVVEESPVVEVLRTTGLAEVARDKLKGPAREKLLRFYRRLDQVLRILENKAYKRVNNGSSSSSLRMRSFMTMSASLSRSFQALVVPSTTTEARRSLCSQNLQVF